MKWSCSRDTFLSALQMVGKSVSSKPPLPSLSCILLETGEKGIYIFGTDLQSGIRIFCPAQVLETGKVAIPARALTETIAHLASGDIECQKQEESLEITQQHQQSVLRGFPAADFPLFPEKEGEVVPLKRDEFIDLVSHVGFSASLDETRPILTTLLFNWTRESIRAVATDGFRLALRTLPITAESEGRFLLPSRVLNEVVRMVQKSQSDEVFEFLTSDRLKQSFITIGNAQMMVRMMDGTFPPYEKIIPDEFRATLLVDREELLEASKAAQVVARDVGNIIQYQVKDRKLSVSAQSSAMGSFKREINVDTSAEAEGEIAFNIRYILDILSFLKTPRVEFSINESLRPARIRPEGDEKSLYLAMPFRVHK